MEGLTIEQTSSRVIIYYCTHCPLFPSFNNHWTTIIYAFFIENRLAFVMCLFIINELFSRSLHLLRKLFCTNGFYVVTMLCFVRKCFALFQYFPNVKMCCVAVHRTGPWTFGRSSASRRWWWLLVRPRRNTLFRPLSHANVPVTSHQLRCLLTVRVVVV